MNVGYMGTRPLKFQSPISGSQTRIFLGSVMGGTPVSIPYKRFTNTLVVPTSTFTLRVSIPYKRVTNPNGEEKTGLILRVSIPYKRVTNLDGRWVRLKIFTLFQSPISGSQTLVKEWADMVLFAFQSPISGSQTLTQPKKTQTPGSFNPL